MRLSTMMTRHDDGNHADDPFEMATWDVSRAHFTVKLAGGSARIYLSDMSKSKLARLCRNSYGTRGAASIWGDTW